MKVNHALGFILTLFVLFSARAFKTQVLARDEQVKSDLAKKGIHSTAQKLNPSSQSIDPLNEWPNVNQRTEVLKKLQSLEDYAIKKNWDEYALDEFLFKASREEASFQELSKEYSDMDSQLLNESIKLSRSYLNRGEGK